MTHEHLPHAVWIPKSVVAVGRDVLGPAVPHHQAGHGGGLHDVSLSW